MRIQITFRSICYFVTASILHFRRTLPSTMLAIKCLVVTNDCKTIGGVVIVDLPPDRRVGVLLEEVKKKKGPVHIPDNIPADALIPWKPHVPFPSHPPHGFANHVDGLNLNSSEDDTGAALSLDPGAELQEYFTEPPPYKVVQVVIQLPSERSLANGELDPLQVVEAEYDTYDGLINYMSTSRYVLDAPSTVSKPNVFREYQKTEDRILNDRPCTDIKVPPLALLYPPFGQFADDLDSEKVPPTNPRKFQLAVDTFASVMCRHFRDKEVRRMAVLGALNGIFRSYEPFSLPLIVPDTIAGERVSDGHANGPAQVMETVVGFEDNTDPEIQNTSCYLQMNDSQMRLGTHKKSFEKYLCPALGISIIGIERHSLNTVRILNFFFRIKHRIRSSSPSRQGKIRGTHSQTLDAFPFWR